MTALYSVIEKAKMELNHLDAEQAKLNFALLTLLKLTKQFESDIEKIPCNCKKVIMKIFLKEIKSYIYTTFTKYVETKDRACICGHTNKLLKILVKVKNRIKCYNLENEEKISEDFLNKFVDIKRQSLIIIKMKIKDLCVKETSYSEFGEDIIDVIIQILATTWGDVSTIFIPECVRCPTTSQRTEELAHQFSIIITDFFENDQWVNNRIHIFKDIIKNNKNITPKVVLDFEYTSALNNNIINNIDVLKKNGFDISWTNATHHNIENILRTYYHDRSSPVL